MNATAAQAAEAVAGTNGPVANKRSGRKKPLLLALPVVLAASFAALWFSGVLPPLLGMAKGKAEPTALANPADPNAPAEASLKAPVFYELPEIIANLNAGARRNSFVKILVKLELSKAADQPVLAASLPRILDLFQTYLREMHPEELRGSAGTYRLREELIARANIAITPARVVNVLFTEMLIQ